MRFLHLSDLHLGKRVCEFSMLDDQRYILEQVLSLLDARPVDGVLLAGDLYDKPVPPAEAVRLLDWFLTELAARGLPVFAVSGNHDSADRIAFGAQLLAGSQVYVSPVFTEPPAPITLTDEYGPVDVWLLPFLKPAAVRHVFPDEKIESYNDAIGCVLNACAPDPDRRNVLVAHQFVAGAAVCESEEPSVGGVDSIDVSLFEGFDYVALGHLHSPQKVGRDTVRYAGSPLKYSFSEAHQHKAALFVTLGEKGSLTATKNEMFRTPAIKQQVVDTTGAGDTFNSSFITYLLMGKSIREAALFANTAGGYSVTQYGPKGGVNDLSFIEELVTRYY